MQQLILKRDLPKLKLEALLNFLKVWEIDIELKKYIPNQIEIDDATLLSEKELSEEWLNPTEDKAWENL